MWGFFIFLSCAVIATGSAFVALGAVGIAALFVKQRREDGPWGSSFKWSLVAGLYLRLLTTLTRDFGVSAGWVLLLLANFPYKGALP